MSSELLESLISHCPLLEKLVLDIQDKLDTTEINAPLLRSFDLTGNISSICLKNVPRLVKLFLHGDYINAEDLDFTKIFESCPSLEHLLFEFLNCGDMKHQQDFPLILTVSNDFTCLTLSWWNHISSHMLFA